MKARYLAHAVTPRGQSDPQILFHRQHGKDLPALGHIADAQVGASLRRGLAEIDAGKVHGPGKHRQEPHNALQQGGLAYTIATHEHGALTLGNLQIKIPEGVTLAVILIEFLDAQHGPASPR